MTLVVTARRAGEPPAARAAGSSRGRGSPTRGAAARGRAGGRGGGDARPGATLDTSALIKAEANDRAFWVALKAAVARGVLPVVPAPVLAQGWRGTSNANVARALAACRVEPLDEPLAREVGLLLGRSGTADIVDATVVVGAVRRGDEVWTSDLGDVERLAAAAGVPVSVRLI